MLSLERVFMNGSPGNLITYSGERRIFANSDWLKKKKIEWSYFCKFTERANHLS